MTKPTKNNQQTLLEILIKEFDEINKFIDIKGRCPQEFAGPHEFSLISRLIAIKLDENKVNLLIPYDRHALLK